MLHRGGPQNCGDTLVGAACVLSLVLYCAQFGSLLFSLALHRESNRYLASPVKGNLERHSRE